MQAIRLTHVEINLYYFIFGDFLYDSVKRFCKIRFWFGLVMPLNASFQMEFSSIFAFVLYRVKFNNKRKRERGAKREREKCLLDDDYLPKREKEH